jgi:uncharacterized protein (TIGR00369 family)
MNDSSSIPEGFKPLIIGGEFMRLNGPIHTKREGDRLLVGFRVEPRHCNPMSMCHGGMLASYADMLLPVTAHALSKTLANRFLPTINLQIDYLAPAPLGAWVVGEGQLLRETRGLVFAQAVATADGVPCLRASGIFKIGPEFVRPPLG